MQKYDESSIQQLKGLEAVRKRPGMYIGSTDVNGLHHLIWEIVDNSIDEALAGFATEISVTLKKDGSVKIADNGRGVPTGMKASGKTAVEMVFTELHAGGKFNEGAYKTSGGLHGVGASVVNALSEKLIATVYRDKKVYETIFENGDNIVQHTKEIGTTDKTGTTVEFWPNYEIFKHAKFSDDIIMERLRESCFLIGGLKIKFRDDITEKDAEFCYENGLHAFVDFVNDSKNAVSDIVTFKDTKKDMEVECGFQYTDSYNETILSFVNNVKTKDGGTHEVGLKSALTKTFNDFALEEKALKGKNTLITDGNEVYINSTGNPYMANGGAGDCLTGIIASLSGQNYELFESAYTGAFLHGYIADGLFKEQYIINASHIIENIPKYMKKLFCGK